MIAKMKKVQLLIPEGDSPATLLELQKLGLMHLDMKDCVENEDLRDFTMRISTLKRCEGELQKYSKVSLGKSSSISEETSLDRSFQIWNKDSAESQKSDSLCEITNRNLEELANINTNQANWKKELGRLEGWGSYNPSKLQHLAGKGIHISLHQTTIRAFKAAEQEYFHGHHIEIIRRSGPLVQFAEIRTDQSLETLFPYENLPAHSCEELQSQMAEACEKSSIIQKKLSQLSQNIAVLQAEIRSLATLQERLNASLSLDHAAEGQLKLLRGYIVLSRLSKLQKYLDSRCILPLITDPESTDTVPVKFWNIPPASLFEPITRIFGLPQYGEIDPTPFFAPFFTLFFGLCLADVGYGLIITLAALTGLFVLEKKAAKALSVLGVILGLATILGGLLFNTIFGVNIDKIPNLPGGLQILLMFKDMNSAMKFSIFLGVIQILIGMLLQIGNRWLMSGPAGALNALANFMLLLGAALWAVSRFGTDLAVGPIAVGSWVASLTAGSPLPGLILMGAAVGIILFFNNLERKIWLRPLLGIWDLYGIATGLPGDILSYIRIFALALAGSLLGGAINLIAGMIRGDNPGILAWFFMVVVLIAGHFINFALATLGAFVHPLRLTFVEFYKATGFSGGGKTYRVYGGTNS